MKKIPTLFKREFANHKVKKILDEVTEGMEWVLKGEGIATLKYDGSCCAIINGNFYKRYDAKKGKKAPEGAIPCCEPDMITGHHPHWVLVDSNNPADKWFWIAYCKEIEKQGTAPLPDGTYEAIGIHFQNNPYGLESDILIKHGTIIIDLPDRSFEGIKNFLTENEIEGIVFWKDGEPKCKIKRSDFGLEWNKK